MSERQVAYSVADVRRGALDPSKPLTCLADPDAHGFVRCYFRYLSAQYRRIRGFVSALCLLVIPISAAGQSAPAPTPSTQPSAAQRFAQLPPEDQKNLLGTYLAQKTPGTPEAASYARQLFDQLDRADQVALLKGVGTDAGEKTLRETGVALLVLSIFLLGWLIYLQRSVIKLAGINVRLSERDDSPSDYKGIRAIERFPMGLPPGTVRSALALSIVAVGLWLYVMQSSGLYNYKAPEALTGILGMVLGFYFGTKTGGADELQDAYRQVADARVVADRQAQAAQEQVKVAITDANAKVAAAVQQADQAQQTATDMQVTAAAATTDSSLDKLRRHTRLNDALVTELIPALPAGILPPDLVSEAVKSLATAKTIINSVRTGSALNPAETQTVTDAINSIAGLPESGSLISRLLKSAAPLLGTAAAAAGGPLSGIAVLLSTGARLGSDAFQRWRARILAAPIATGLVEFGSITPDDARDALAKSPTLLAAFEGLTDGDGFFVDLTNTILSQDAVDQIWKQYGPGGECSNGKVLDRRVLEQGVGEFREALMAARSAADIREELLGEIVSTLSNAASPDLRPGPYTKAQVEQLIKTVGAASLKTPPNAEENLAQAAFDALVLLVGYARRDSIDLAKTLSEVAT